MRKKSHLSLSRYLLDNIDSELLEEHRKAFMVGSVLPDCRPSFVTTKHNMEETFAMVRKTIFNCTIDTEDYKNISTAYCRKLGEISHYLADYFTYPHNEDFEGSIRQHCMYEKVLKNTLREYIKSGDIHVNVGIAKSFRTPDEICQFVLDVHRQYMDGARDVEEDCKYIVALCHIAVTGILHLMLQSRFQQG